MEKQNNTRLRGFGSMDKERVRSIASLGGIAAHRKGTAHEWDSKEASAAGKIGGRSPKPWQKKHEEIS